MDKIKIRPNGKADNNITVPLIAAVAIAIALGSGWLMMSGGNQDQAGMATQSSSTGVSSGEAGQGSVQNTPIQR